MSNELIETAAKLLEKTMQVNVPDLWQEDFAIAEFAFFSRENAVYSKIKNFNGLISPLNFFFLNNKYEKYKILNTISEIEKYQETYNNRNYYSRKTIINEAISLFKIIANKKMKKYDVTFQFDGLKNQVVVAFFQTDKEAKRFYISLEDPPDNSAEEIISELKLCGIRCKNWR